ncbi:ABC-three component system protein [Nocardiopsis alkaliphila]|uniref:ABC-three component system protein n=1 Tax=Nocardiopsis alkaliphila TaxID=225762 RepID=UPI00034857E7|nr:ABC-three component system protein [Nocardiopsis alkaliphila]
MEPWQRWCARTMLKDRTANLHGEAFEDFFHRLMQLADPGFFPVRTTRGDRGADGLLISGRRLYACYGPQTANEYEVGRKFRSDLHEAITHRGDDFDTFVFVHNNSRGVAPQVTLEISEAQADHPSLKFENFGLDQMFRVLRRLDSEDIEDLIGPFPLKAMVTGVGMAELAPLLDHLSTNRKRSSLPTNIPIPPSHKLEYNRFGEDMADFLRLSLPHVPLVKDYYDGLADPIERDEVAAAFRQEYLDLADTLDDPDAIVVRLQWYILGNEARSPKDQIEANTVLMYFFGECEIFEIPPQDWPTAHETMEGGTT